LIIYFIGWDREPPDHGLKRYWESQQYNVIEQNPVETSLHVDSNIQHKPTQNQSQLPETSPERRTCEEESPKATKSVLKIPHDLEKQRDEILSMQKMLEQEQEKLQMKRNEVECQIMAVLSGKG
jgi:site-specific DNA-cytosine methylase